MFDTHTMMQPNQHTLVPRPPIVTVMGHIDHGKSTLLDYIRSTHITDTEAGGITQHISAYEVHHKTPQGELRTITFLDTPGHEAFQHLRSRGSQVADMAILVVAADDGVKPQTMEAFRAIQESGIPYMVAITKIDKPNAHIERAKSSLVEHGIYLEGMGGDIPYVSVSSKTGENIPALLDLLLLMADMEELTGDPTIPAEGLIIESHCDPKRGISATIIIRNGILHTGEYVVAGNAYAPLRIVEDFLGQRIESASFSSPLNVVGFSDIPPVGAPFVTVANKKSAVRIAGVTTETIETAQDISDCNTDNVFVLPVIIKSDVVGSIEALTHELRKQENERTQIRVIHTGIGAVSESDLKTAIGGKDTVVVGFNVGVDLPAQELAERYNIEVARFSIIYDFVDWIPGVIEARRPKIRGEVEIGRAKVLKCFSFARKQQTIGCRVVSGKLGARDRIRVFRGDVEIGRGHVESLKSGKSDVSQITAVNDCGALIHVDMDTQPSYDDVLVAFTVCES